MLQVSREQATKAGSTGWKEGFHCQSESRQCSLMTGSVVRPRQLREGSKLGGSTPKDTKGTCDSNRKRPRRRKVGGRESEITYRVRISSI